jgi:hypothetical protein
LWNLQNHVDIHGVKSIETPRYSDAQRYVINRPNEGNRKHYADDGAQQQTIHTIDSTARRTNKNKQKKAVTFRPRLFAFVRFQLCGVELVSGVVLLGLVLFGVEFDDGLEVLPELDEFVSVLLELGFGVALLPPELDGDVEFMSELDGELLVDDGDVVDDGEVDVLDPVWLDEVDGTLCALFAPLPAPLPSLLPTPEPALLWAIAIPVEKIATVAIVRSFFRIVVFS